MITVGVGWGRVGSDLTRSLKPVGSNTRGITRGVTKFVDLGWIDLDISNTEDDGEDLRLCRVTTIQHFEPNVSQTCLTDLLLNISTTTIVGYPV